MSARLVSQAELNAFGRRLARLRMAKNWSQTDLAIKIGCSPRSIGQWEYGERVPAADWLHAMAQALRVSMDELWTGARR